MKTISVVIASVNGRPSIDECLSALSSQQCDYEIEVIVVDSCHDGTAEFIRSHFPDVRLIEVEGQPGIPQLRSIGIAQARGDFIAVTEDHCMAPPNWLQQLVDAQRDGFAAVGGTIENGCTQRLIDWAVYLCEYSQLMPPIPAGEAEGLPGNNVAYRREWLEKVDPSIKSHYWEYFLHQEMKRLGARFLMVPAITLLHKKEFGFGYFMAQRFHYSRSFAGMRRAGTAPAKRLIYALASPLLPALMLWRMTREVLKKKRHRKEFLLSFPLLAAFMVPYAIGEMVGYLCGGGKSLEQVQ